MLNSVIQNSGVKLFFDLILGIETLANEKSGNVFSCCQPVVNEWFQRRTFLLRAKSNIGHCLPFFAPAFLPN